MAEILDVFDALSTPVKISWVVWLGWGAGQIYWYRAERTRVVKPAVARARTIPSKPVHVKKPRVREEAWKPKEVIGLGLSPIAAPAEEQPRGDSLSAPGSAEPMFDTSEFDAALRSLDSGAAGNTPTRRRRRDHTMEVADKSAAFGFSSHRAGVRAEDGPEATPVT